MKEFLDHMKFVNEFIFHGKKSVNSNGCFLISLRILNEIINKNQGLT